MVIKPPPPAPMRAKLTKRLPAMPAPSPAVLPKCRPNVEVRDYTIMEIKAIMDVAIDNLEHFGEFHEDFIEDMIDRLKKYGADSFVSAKQHEVIHRISNMLIKKGLM